MNNITFTSNYTMHPHSNEMERYNAILQSNNIFKEINGYRDVLVRVGLLDMYPELIVGKEYGIIVSNNQLNILWND